MKKVIGLLMFFSPLLLVFVIHAIEYSLFDAVTIWGAVLILAVTMIAGLNMLFD